ncbi:hypothetical protein [Deinococcus sp. JMULE3]|uniref:hypothetical protein n=1 Tax=Deinococcus sp. JMULE3 TaxID=2518341 RepID=UPI0015750588|nr:hypothetical protein [Deinococcus sp. JMULE3]NTY00716.1 hypothetical protein [Deinococcus sp. JMULE3]
MKRLPIPTLILPVLLVPALSACAPGLSGPAVTDPIFVPGQEWKVSLSDTISAGKVPEVVPPRDFWTKSTALYTKTESVPNLLSMTYTFQYSPAGKTPEFISFQWRGSVGRADYGYVCVVRTEGKVAVGQVLTGVTVTGQSNSNLLDRFEIREYLQTGALRKEDTCTMQRVK